MDVLINMKIIIGTNIIEVILIDNINENKNVINNRLILLLGLQNTKNNNEIQKRNASAFNFVE